MRVHHIEFLCKDLNLQVHKFCHSFGFSVIGKWNDSLLQKEKVVLKKNAILFVLHEDPEASCDHVDNISLEVDNLEKICNALPNDLLYIKPKIIDENTDILRLKEPQCFVKGAVMTSPVGKIKHSLFDKSKFYGSFLPNFMPFLNCEESIKHGCKSYDEISKLDHITLAVEIGTSFELMEWYSKRLNMSRSKVNNNEENDGFKIETINKSGNRLGLRLTAMQYHFCSEQTLTMPNNFQITGRKADDDVKLIFAESLLGQGPNQVDTFLKENHGPGVQHIGLSTSDIFTSVEDWTARHVSFIAPPKNYYDEGNEMYLDEETVYVFDPEVLCMHFKIDEKIKKIENDSLRTSLENHGILLDIETDDEIKCRSRYLLQVFTKPIFSRKTFFFELIQRHGATGFGAGNISALWRAVDAYLRDRASCTDDQAANT